ncbi:hypothetical protein KDW_27470 [Dictyobacter vulcani]|uniref:Uncharacterized protein n=1 Tax=Dictyobacter vulcani TaxID=2607529 RepID=A0A5J4KL48_9CHLR|nr:hypothetical protein KDW_27470 [Dictyobacter vulcani]
MPLGCETTSADFMALVITVEAPNLVEISVHVIVLQLRRHEPVNRPRTNAKLLSAGARYGENLDGKIDALRLPRMIEGGV